MGTCYDQLHDAIMSGEFAAGAALAENALASRFGVSRTPVREALRRLEQDGLVERGPQGMQVRTRSPEEILEIYGVRITLEALAAREAAERRSDLDVVRLRDNLDIMSATSTDDGSAMAAVNRSFHAMVWAASHNNTLIDLLNRLSTHLTRYPATTLTHPGRWQAVLAEHADLVDAIAAKDAERAATIGESHMTAAKEIRLRMFSQGVS